MRRALLALALALALAACQPAESPWTAKPTPDGYHRALFGAGWADLDNDGCDTRAEVLIRDMTGETFSKGCHVQAGTLTDPYTGLTLRVEAKVLDVDHVVSLADAYRSGANSWTFGRRVLFSNDEANLLATAASVNRSKGDDGPDEWRPPNPASGCRYAQTYAATKRRWTLTITPGQQTAITALCKRKTR